MRIAFVIAGLALAFVAQAGNETLDYAHQDAWQVVHGKAQSPIDIVTSKAVPAAAGEPAVLQLPEPRASVEEVVDNGHAVEVETHPATAVIRGRPFTLAQFHFHAPAEHTIDGKRHPLEGHFVFKAQDGRLAVVGVMYDVGGANPVIQAVLDDLGGTHKAVAAQQLDLTALLPRQHGLYHYLGSLTTPPLTENVEWYVMDTPVHLSQAQLDAFRARYRHNNRNVQPLNGRPVIHYQD